MTKLSCLPAEDQSLYSLPLPVSDLVQGVMLKRSDIFVLNLLLLFLPAFTRSQDKNTDFGILCALKSRPNVIVQNEARYSAAREGPSDPSILKNFPPPPRNVDLRNPHAAHHPLLHKLCRVLSQFFALFQNAFCRS